MSGMINTQAEDLMCSMSGVSGGQALIGFLFSTFLPFPKCEVCHMLCTVPSPLSISLLWIRNYGVPVPINLQECTSPGIWSQMIIKYMSTPPAMITTAEPLWALINKLMSVPVRCFWVWKSEPIHPISSAGIYFCLNNYSTNELDSKIPPWLQEFLHVAHCTQVLRNHLHNYDFMAYTEWLFQGIGTAGWVEDPELKWTDVPDVKDICESGLLFLWRLNITLIPPTTEWAQVVSGQTNSQFRNQTSNHLQNDSLQPAKRVLVLEDPIQSTTKSYKLPLTTTEVASDQLMFSTSQPCV